MTDAAAPAQDDVSGLSFEQALAELEQIVAELESGRTELEESIRKYERGARLKAHCEQRLAAAKMRVEKIVVGQDGRAQGVEPAAFD